MSNEEVYWQTRYHYDAVKEGCVKLFVKSVDFDGWRDFIMALPSFSFFQTPYWALAYQETYPNMRSATKVFAFSDGTEVLVPCIETRRFGLVSHYSTIDGYGGFMCRRFLDFGKIVEIAGHLKNKSLFNIVCPYPLAPSSSLTEAAFGLSGFKVNCSFTHILKVDKPETLYRKFSHSCRKNINRAQREGLKLTLGGVQDVDVYYQIYLSSVERRGGKEFIVPKAFFVNLLKASGDMAKLLFVEKDEEKIAGVVMLYGRGESFQWHASAYYKYENLRPSNFWEWEVLKYAYNSGYSIHNFGSSDGLDGVKAFKESFGTERVDYSYYTYCNPLLGAYKKLRGQ